MYNPLLLKEYTASQSQLLYKLATSLNFPNFSDLSGGLKSLEFVGQSGIFRLYYHIELLMREDIDAVPTKRSIILLNENLSRVTPTHRVHWHGGALISNPQNI